jgi:hypothetical protein
VGAYVALVVFLVRGANDMAKAKRLLRARAGEMDGCDRSKERMHIEGILDEQKQSKAAGEHPQTVEEMADRIVEGVAIIGGHVSPGELLNYLGDCARGDRVMVAKNIHMFPGSSDLFLDAVVLLVNSYRVEVKTTNLMILAWDNSPMLDLPIGKRVTVKGYKTPHFVPAVLCLPTTERKKRKFVSKKRKRVIHTL